MESIAESPLIALLSPFTPDGAIDYDSFTEYLTFLQSKGVTSVITNGSTAEFASLTLRERQTLVEHTRKHFSGTIVNNVSASAVADVVDLAQHSKEYADALLLLPAYYYSNPPRAGMIAFFEQVLTSVEQPTLLYNFPLHATFEIDVAFATDLARKFPHLRGIKDSSGKLDTARQFLKTRKQFDVFLGNDSKCVAALVNGMSGLASGAGNSFPEVLVALHQLQRAGDVDAALDLQDTFNREWNNWRKDLVVEQIALSKFVLTKRIGGFAKSVRPPLLPLSEDPEEQVQKKLLSMEKFLKSLPPIES